MESTFESNGFKVHIITEGLREREDKLIFQAAQLMVNVIGDPAFKVFCENYKYEVIKTGAEVLNGKVDNEADINLNVDRSFGRKCIGYTYKSSAWQYICQWVMNSWGPEDIASNLAHEWCHKMSYKHEYKRTSRRQYSVPYAVGDYVEYVCKKKLLKKKL